MSSADASQPFAGQVALVTGGSGGIGRACALALARAGADVAVNFYSMAEEAESLAAEVRALGRRVVLLPVDIANHNDVEEMVAHVEAEFGPITLLVLSAVYSDREAFIDADLEGFRRTIDVSMWGAFHVLRAVARHMVRRGSAGSVVVVSSPHAHAAIPTCMAYNMAKAANDQMARTAAIELIGHKIRVNIVYPGWTDTPGERKFFSEEALRAGARKLPMGRMVRPDEVARGVLFLLHPDSESITGTTLSVDGGSQLPWWSRRGKDGDF
jgi:glucose 1-dehydrogenase